MASFSNPMFLSISLSLCMALLISPAHSQNCSSTSFSSKTYSNCSDLPTLNATLHYTYDAANSSLSIAFVAAPAKPDGWVGWGVNLNKTGMAGAQSLVAMKSNGTDSIIVKKFNLISYREINETTSLAVDVWNLSGASSGGNFVIFASVKVPTSLEKLNQIWQVGPSVSNGFPAKHAFDPANLQAKGTLDLVASTSVINGTNSTTGSENSNSSSGASYSSNYMNVGYQVGLFVAVTSLISFW